MPPVPKLAADCMLGGLARWLRLLGLDTIYLTGPPTLPLPGRILITRRSQRPHQPKLTSWERVIRITANHTPYQVAETINALALARDHIAPLTRCSLCNHSLETVLHQDVAGQVPPYVIQTQSIFRRCPECGRIYWGGTHRDRMSEMIDRLWTAEGRPRSDPFSDITA